MLEYRYFTLKYYDSSEIWRFLSNNGRSHFNVHENKSLKMFWNHLNLWCKYDIHLEALKFHIDNWGVIWKRSRVEFVPDKMGNLYFPPQTERRKGWIEQTGDQPMTNNAHLSIGSKIREILLLISTFAQFDSGENTMIRIWNPGMISPSIWVVRVITRFWGWL